jgi:hypothetical protein
MKGDPGKGKTMLLCGIIIVSHADPHRAEDLNQGQRGSS